MEDDLSLSIERLRNSTKLLNSVCDSAALTIRETETFLEACSIGMWAGVSLGFGAGDPEAQEPDWEDLLCYYQQSSGKFRIGVQRRYIGQHPSTNDLKPWAESSRDVKIDSFGKLPELLQTIATSVHLRADQAQRTVESVNSLIKLPKKKVGG